MIINIEIMQERTSQKWFSTLRQEGRKCTVKIQDKKFKSANSIEHGHNQNDTEYVENDIIYMY